MSLEDAVTCAGAVYLLVADLVRNSAYATQVFKLVFANGCYLHNISSLSTSLVPPCVEVNATNSV
jgi:hypothetical protein